jgi:hypothetical protein
MNNRSDFKRRLKQTILLVTSYSLLVTIIGCEAFVRKFTRKPKKEDLPQEEMVLAPEEYKSNISKEDLYRQYFLFWKSWQSELIESLVQKRSNKKQVDCIDEAIKNLLNLRTLLNAEKQQKLDAYIARMQELRGAIASDIYSNSVSTNAQAAERLKMNILRDFSYDKIKDYLA